MRNSWLAGSLSVGLVGVLPACGDDGGGTTGGTDETTTTTSSSDSAGSSSTTGDSVTASGSGSATTTASGGTTAPTGGSSGGSTGGGVDTAGEGCNLIWHSGFENGFPGGEWDTYDNGSWSPDGNMPAGRVSAWTIVDESSGEPIHSGSHAYRGWIEAADTESHRPYPGVSPDVQTPFVNTFWVYLDLDYDILGDEWVHFGTWGNFEDGAGLYALHTMSVRFRQLEFAHTEPFAGEYIGPEPQPEYPLGQWVRFTVYGHYEGNTGFVQVWQDGVPMLRATVSQLGDHPGTRMTYAHWGMYAGSTASQGRQYNDDISLWSLDGPLADLETEPDCWQAP